MADKKTVIITGMFGPYLGELNDQLGENVEIWGCNMSYTLQPGLTGLFIFDPPEHWLPNKDKYEAFIADVNDLGIPIYMQEKHERIPRSVPFPAEALIDEYGFAYFQSTLTWQVAYAISQGFERIIMHRIHCMPDSAEYFPQKAGMDFWLGMAYGRGVEIMISDDSHLCRPHPWHSPIYGYEQKIDGDIIAQAISGILRQLLRLTPKWENGSPIADRLRDKYTSMKREGQLKFYEFKEIPRKDAILPTRLSLEEKRAEIQHVRDLNRAKLAAVKAREEETA